jgi:hypothetical protein
MKWWYWSLTVPQPFNRTLVKTRLLALLQNVVFPNPINSFTTWVNPATRRLKLFNQVDPSTQPACFLVQHKEDYVSVRAGNLSTRYLDMGVWCYAPTGTEGVTGDDYLDWMEYGLEGVLLPDDPIRNELTLGQSCYWCRAMRRDGLYIRDPGDIDGQALLVFPIRILLP